MAKRTYLEGTPVRVTGTFKTLVDGVLTLTDPTTITLIVEAPGGTQTTYTYAAGSVARDSRGVYHKDLSATILNAVGWWIYRWVGTDAAEGPGEEKFRIVESEVV